MGTRQYDQQDLSVVKQPVSLWAHVLIPTPATGAPLLQKWQYSALGAGTQGTTVNAYTNATTAAAPLGQFQNYQAGADGVFSVTRTGAGLWTIVLQDNYIRLLSLAVHQTIAGGTANIVAIGENSTISNMRTANGSTIGVALLSSTATAADPTAASTIHIHMRLQNVSEP